jgi:O-antigen/teichoic acid export membrane protein
MNTTQRIAKNTAALFAAQFVVSLLGLALSIFIARSLGDVTFGKYSFALAFTAIFVVFSDLGYNTLLIRDVARDKTQATKYLNNIIGIHALLAILIFALIVITINVMDYPADTKNVVYLFGIYTLVVSFSAVFKVTFRAFEKMEYEAGISIFTNIIRVSLGLLVLFLGYGLIELALVFILSGVFDFLFSLFICERKFVKPKMELNFDFLKSTIMIALPLSMLSIFGIIYVRADTVMLSMMKGDAVVGWYNAAYNLIIALKIIPTLFLTSLFPAALSVFNKSRNQFYSYYEKSIKYLIAIGLPMAIGITLLSKSVILFIYGSQYSNSITVLQILSWDCLLLFIYAALGNALVGMGKERQVALSALVCACVNVALNFLLIPKFSLIGSAVATVFAETILLLSYLYLMKRYLRGMPIHKFMVKPILSSVPMIGIVTLLNANLILVILLSAITYSFVFFVIGGVEEEEKRLVYSSFHTIKKSLHRRLKKSF